MLRNWQCEVLSCEENGLTFHLSLSTGFRHAPVRLHRTTSAAFGQLHSRCGQLISEMTACVVHDKILNCAKCVIKLLQGIVSVLYRSFYSVPTGVVLPPRLWRGENTGFNGLARCSVILVSLASSRRFPHWQAYSREISKFCNILKDLAVYRVER